MRNKNIKWQSEEGNDQWVAEIFNYKHNGYFVDAGATGGLNNSAIVLEKQFNWSGISVNANKSHYDLIVKKQKRMNVEHSALWSHNNGVEFYYSPIGQLSKTHKSFMKNKPQDLSYASAVKGCELNHSASDLKKYASLVQVSSITLESLLKKYNAPNIIDYVAMDIENSEHEVLRVFPFNKYKILALSVENSEDSQILLENNGFTRVVNPFCPKPFEHHYVNNEIIKDYPFATYE